MSEITFQVQHHAETGGYSASWDDPNDLGGITTQGTTLQDLQEQLLDAVSLHFDGEEVPVRIRLHFVNDPILLHA